MIPEIESFIRSGGGIPLFDQTVPAGFPSPAENQEYEGLNIVEFLIPRPENTFLCKVTDAHLADRGIFPGDIHVGRSDQSPALSDLVLIENEGEIRLLPYPGRTKEILRGVICYALREPLNHHF